MTQGAAEYTQGQNKSIKYGNAEIVKKFQASRGISALSCNQFHMLNNNYKSIQVGVAYNTVYLPSKLRNAMFLYAIKLVLIVRFVKSNIEDHSEEATIYQLEQECTWR